MSILSVDFGSVHTRAVLFDLVEGRYQLLAVAETRSTDNFPVNDIAVGLDRVLRELTETTGRNFTGPDGRITTPENVNRVGVDVFTATASIGRPLRAVVVGLHPDLSVASAQRAASGTYVDVATAIHLADGRDMNDRLNAILLNTPDVIMIAGGTEGGAQSSVMALIDTVRLAITLIDKSRRPTIIFAGNSQLAAQLTSIFEGLTTLLIAQNVRPSADDERIESAQLQLARAFDLYKEERSQDFAPIAATSAVGVLPTAQGYRIVADYLGKTYAGGVALIDIGSAASVLAASFGGDVSTVIRSDLGLGHNALSLLKTVGTESIRRWLPFTIDENELYNYAANKMLRPATVPASLRDLYIEHSLMRAGMDILTKAARPTWTKTKLPGQIGLIIGAGATLTKTGNPSYSALLMLDALQPVGISQLFSDSFGVIPALGAMASIESEAAVQVLDGANLEPLGTAISLAGVPGFDKNSIRVKILLDSGEVISQIVKGGHVWVYPLSIGQTATLRLRVGGRGLSINGRRRLRIKVRGGTAGIIFDARGRRQNFESTLLTADLKTRAMLMPLWAHEVTGDPLLEIDPSWVEPLAVSLDEDEGEGAAPAGKRRGRRRGEARPARRGLFRRRGAAGGIEAPSLDEDLFEEEAEDDSSSADALRELRDASLS